MSGVVVVPLRGVGRGTLDSLAEEHSSWNVGLIPSSSTPSSCFLVSYLVTRACGFVASSVWELTVGLSVVLVYDVSLCERMQFT